MSVSNCVWPTTFSVSAGHKTNDPTALANSAVGVAVVNGLTINMRDGISGNVSVTFT